MRAAGDTDKKKKFSALIKVARVPINVRTIINERFVGVGHRRFSRLSMTRPSASMRTWSASSTPSTTPRPRIVKATMRMSRPCLCGALYLVGGFSPIYLFLELPVYIRAGLTHCIS